MYKRDKGLILKAKQHEKYVDSIEKFLPPVTSVIVKEELFHLPSGDYDVVEDLTKKMEDNFVGKVFSDYGSTTVKVTDRTTTDEAIAQCEENGLVNTVLNFADFKVAGGMYLSGSTAQEELLCHNTNLYRHLKSLDSCFYKPNSEGVEKGVYTNNSILLRSISIIKDENREVNMGDTSKLDIHAVDVVTTAMPNYRVYKRYYERIGRDIELLSYLKCLFFRIGQILGCCKRLGNKTIILGACDCRALGNRPEWVALAFNYWLTHEFKGVFDKVLFAVPKSGFKAGDNNKIFRLMLD